jgi:hypothetical protein
MYYQHLLHKEQLVYNISMPFQVSSEIGPETLKHIFQILVDRHDGLRTGFLLSGEGVSQRITREVVFELEILDSGKYDGPVNAFRDFIRPFDLSGSSLMRCGFLNLGKRGNFLFVDIHHIVADGYSLGVLINDFKKVYAGVELSPLPLRYVDYAAWLSQGSEKLIRARDFWIHVLSGKLNRVDLPLIGDRESVDVQDVSCYEVEIDGETRRDVKGFVAASGVSDFMLLLSVYYVLLSKMSGNADIIIGSEAIGRSERGLKDVVGTFVNVLPLRVQVNAESTFSDFLDDVRNCVLESFDHQDLSFDQIVALLNTSDRETFRNPIFDFYFSFSDIESGGDSPDTPLFTPVTLTARLKGEYEFSVNIRKENNTVKLMVIYSQQLYDAAMVRLMVTYFNSILKEVLARPTVKIEDIRMSAFTERPLISIVTP